ncbi:MAG: hypothetical protein J07HX64_02988 [halophilic archaeon J07HX64]|nr:MAG: hypothetical protein J07HX64_02988 [halophilic archaeon J07HX64]
MNTIEQTREDCEHSAVRNRMLSSTRTADKGVAGRETLPPFIRVSPQKTEICRTLM